MTREELLNEFPWLENWEDDGKFNVPYELVSRLTKNDSPVYSTSFGYRAILAGEDSGKAYTIYLTPRSFGGKYVRVINATRILPRPKNWSLKINTLEDFIQEFASRKAQVQRMLGIFASLYQHIGKKYKRSYAILTSEVRSDDIKRLIELNVLAPRTEYYNKFYGISKTYWVNRKISRLLADMQNKLGTIFPKLYETPKVSEFHKVFSSFVLNVNNYLYDKRGTMNQFDIHDSEKFEDCVSGRIYNEYSNLPSKENHPDMDLIKTRQGKLLKRFGFEVTEESYKKNYFKYDVVSSIPRIVYLLNHGVWIDESIDLYFEMYKRSTDYDGRSEEEFDKELREQYKTDVLKCEFSHNDNRDSKRFPEVYEYLGKNIHKSEIFLFEGYIYVMVLGQLLVNSPEYTVNIVYDCFEFYGEHRPTNDKMKKLIKDTALEFYYIYKTEDYTKLLELQDKIQHLKGYHHFPEDVKKMSKREIIMLNDLYSTVPIGPETSWEDVHQLLSKYMEENNIIVEDNYSDKFNDICKEIERLLSTKEEIHYKDLNISEKTWRNLQERKEFKDKFIGYRGKIRRKIIPY